MNIVDLEHIVYIDREYWFCSQYWPAWFGIVTW